MLGTEMGKETATVIEVTITGVYQKQNVSKKHR